MLSPCIVVNALVCGQPNDLVGNTVGSMRVIYSAVREVPGPKAKVGTQWYNQ